VAAAVILAGGALLALANPDDASEASDQRIVVKVNDSVEAIELEDLADGETREFTAGDHTIAVTRTGDRLDVHVDGSELLGGAPGSHQIETMVWVGDENAAEPDLERVFVMKGAGEASGEVQTYTIRTRTGEGDGEVTLDIEAIADGGLAELDALGHAETMVFAPHGAHPVVVAGPGMRSDMVRYRCEETGSELLVGKDDALSDSYVCPATGCLMVRVNEPQVHVVKIVKTQKREHAQVD
jgi:hypothetical protein